MTSSGRAGRGFYEASHLAVLLTYIFPASSSRAHSKVTSQFPDVRNRGGPDGPVGCVTGRKREEEKNGRNRLIF